MKIYVASSWRNNYQPIVVEALRGIGFDVYDFKNPTEGNHGFSWRQLDPDWENWTTDQYIKNLEHPIAEHGFNLDFNAMLSADIGVLVMPAGRSANIEAGYFVGAGKPLFVYIPEKIEPELMYKMAVGIYPTLVELLTAVSKFTNPGPAEYRSIEPTNLAPKAAPRFVGCNGIDL